MDEIYRPPLSRALAVGLVAVAALALGWSVVASSPGDVARTAPWLALFALAVWATFWRPCVVVSDGGVRLVNVTRTVDVPWPALQDLDTKFALTLVTAYGRYRAWAAPAPGARTVVRAGTERPMVERPDGRPVREADVHPGSGRADTPSGDAATMVRRRWERLRRDGHLDDPRLEFSATPVRWHVGLGASALLLLGAGVLGLLV